MSTLRRALHRPPALPTPEPALRLNALLLRTDPALALTGRRGMSTCLREAGSAFGHPQLGEALASLPPATPPR